MLVRGHRTHPNSQIDLNKRDQGRPLCPRELLKHGLDHPTRRERERSHDGVVRALQAAERYWVRRRVDGRGRGRVVAKGPGRS